MPNSLGISRMKANNDVFGGHLRAWLQAITELRREGVTIEFQEPSYYGESPGIVAPVS